MTVLGTSPYPYVSVEDAALILRMNKWTLYRNMQDIPHIKLGGIWKIHVSFLMLEYTPPVEVTKYLQEDMNQLEFEYDVPIRTVRRYRNTREMIKPFAFSLGC